MRIHWEAPLLTFGLLGLLLLGLTESHGSHSRSTGSPPAAANDFRDAISVSPFTEVVLSTGISYTDGKFTATTVEDLQKLYVAHGANEVYARIATSRKKTPGFGDHSLDRGLMRAKLAKSLGLPFNPELGLFHIYGDVRCQPAPDFSEYPELRVPGTWTSLTIDQMLPVMRSYGAAVAKLILETGVKVRIWDLGNEVDFGVAGVAPQPMPGDCGDPAQGSNWYLPPEHVDAAIGKASILGLLRMSEAERIAWLRAHVWPHEARLLAAVAQGVRSVDPKAEFSTHVSGILAVRPREAIAFFQAMKEGGYLPDQLGFSFYPTSTDIPPDRLQAFQQTVTAAHTVFGRPVFIAEFAYPAAEMAAKEGMFASWNKALDHYPLTPQGQSDIMRELARWGVDHGVSGIRPWAPELTVAAWDSFALFDLKGKTATARSSLDAIAEGAHLRK